MPRAENGAIYKGRPSNDQTYMLCRLTREQAARAVFPLGTLEKTQTRAMAEEFGLPVAHKGDSMEICFIPDKDYIGWLGRRAELPGAGDFVLHGEVVGRHEDLPLHRRPAPPRHDRWRKVYVSRIDARTNTVELALWRSFSKTEVTARDFNWLIDAPDKPIRARCACGIQNGKTRRARSITTAAWCASSATSRCAPRRLGSPPCCMTATGCSAADL